MGRSLCPTRTNDYSAQLSSASLTPTIAAEHGGLEAWRPCCLRSVLVENSNNLQVTHTPPFFFNLEDPTHPQINVLKIKFSVVLINASRKGGINRMLEML